MTRDQSFPRTLAAASVALLTGVLVAWGPPGQDVPVETQETREAEVYRGTFAPIGGSGVEGEVIVQRKGEQLSVRVNARGLSSGAHGQHIHEGASCDSFGGIGVPLDHSLGTIEGGFGGEFPSTEGNSATLTYNEKGSNASFAGLDLANSTVVIHAGAPGPPVACAELDEKGN